ncbi:MAG: mechanosensitive ion channel family protein [Hyphomicrobiales bacterium]
MYKNILAFALIVLITLPLSAVYGNAQQSEAAANNQASSAPIRTDSPRETFTSFLRLSDEIQKAIIAYQANNSWANFRHLELIMDQLIALIDMSNVPRASRREVGYDTVAFLLDIFGRVDLPETDSIPNLDSFKEDVSSASWRVPGTPIRIAKEETGTREGEFLFNARTIVAAPRFYGGVKQLPLRSRLGPTSWNTQLPQLTGPLVPSSIAMAMPEVMLDSWFDTPLWKVLFTLSLFVLSFLAIARIYRWTHAKDDEDARLRSKIVAVFPPLFTILIVLLLDAIISRGIIVVGGFATFSDIVLVSVSFCSFAWIVWVAILAFFESIIASPKISEDSLDANLLRLTARLIGIIAVVLVLAIGAQELGLPVLSLLTGLGIGGLAVALAIRPTLENLIGGFILYIDKPVRVGDFCNFGDHTGTVEKIGIRSTEIRALDRTLISIPNAKFADMEIVNWAQCDRMLITTVIGLRYETSSDQLRYVLANIRKMFHAHPRIDNDTIRVRFSGYGDFSLDVDIRVYAETREWNEFFAIKEDVLMRISDIVDDSGTGFAFPSQTLYMGQDEGVDTERGEVAEKQVDRWRKRGKLPFPRLSGEQISEIEDTLDYPPKGSVELGEEVSATYEPEALSNEPLSAAQGEAEQETSASEQKRPTE